MQGSTYIYAENDIYFCKNGPGSYTILNQSS